MNARKSAIVWTGVLLFLSLVFTAGAQEDKHANKPAEDRVSGVVKRMNNDTKTITVRTNKGDVDRQVIYNDQTKFTKQNKPGASIDDVKEGTRVICLGKFDANSHLTATQIDIRLPK